MLDRRVGVVAVGLALLDSGAFGDEPFESYVETIPETELSFGMAAIPGGEFLMGSPEDEEGRLEDEGPQTKVTIAPFWMGVCEVTWDEYDFYAFQYDLPEEKRHQKHQPIPAGLTGADAVSRPTPPYVDMTFGYGHDRFPAICMTHHAATKYCEWLSEKTGKQYRLPTEAEWEYACRAGTTGPTYLAEEEELLDHAWIFDNSDFKPQPVGSKKPNAFGLYDMLGNVSEWCQDTYTPEYFEILRERGTVANPVVLLEDELWHAVRGGSYEDDAEFVRAAARRGAEDWWSLKDPQSPKSIWWHTDAHFVGFRVVRSLSPNGGLADGQLDRSGTP